jgi:hypothetical protein
MKVTTIRQTCNSCPSQFEGVQENGHMIYIKYRDGYFTVKQSKIPTTDITDALRGNILYDEKIGEDLDGSMDYPTVKLIIESITSLTLPEVCE